MGSFNFTCALSGLPITCGDDVKYFLLTENPYEDSLVCSSHDMWFPRSTPVSAKYNDYGSIDNYDEGSPGVYAIVAALTQDLIEVGTGNNSAHDVPTSKGMSFGEILDAVWERRILVKREYDPDKKEEKVPAGLPTLQRIAKILSDAGYKTNDGYENDAGYYVDEMGDGWIRIREGGFGEKASLEVLLPLLTEYATVITAGTGNYSNRCEIQVMPLPGSPEEYRSFLDESRKKKPSKVFQAMVLQEVWDALCAIGKYKTYRKKIQKEWDQSVGSWVSQLKEEAATEKLLTSSRDPELLALLRRMQTRSPRSAAYSHIPYTMGVGEHFTLAAERHAATPFTDDQVSVYLDDIAGFNCLQEMIYGIRYWWRPSFSCGPQFGGYQEQADWNQIFATVGLMLKKKHHEEDDDYDDDYDEEEVDDDASS